MSSMLPATLAQHLSAQLGPMLADAGYELVDVELDSVGGSSVVRVLVDLAQIQDGPFGRIDLEGVSSATRLIDAHLDAADPIETAFTLEVSSPGLERPLRTPAHFARFVGTEVSVKTVPGTPGERRRTGILIAADSEFTGTITITDRSGEYVISYASIDRARTVFKWGEQIGPGETASGQPRKKGALPKGQRPVHPKAAAALAAAALLAAEPGSGIAPDGRTDDSNESADDLDDDLDDDFDDSDDDFDETFEDDLDDEDDLEDDLEDDPANDLADELDAEPEPGALASRSPQQQPPRLATPGHNARPTEHENPEVTS